MEFVISTLTPWHWLTLGVLFFAIELFAPSTFLLWPAVAAIATGLITWLSPLLGWPAISWQLQIALFAILAIIATLFGRHFFKNNLNKASAYPTLNRRGESVKGRRITLTEPIINGVGSTTIDNTRWRVVGPDTPAGSNLTVTGTDGASLTVEVINNQ